MWKAQTVIHAVMTYVGSRVARGEDESVEQKTIRNFKTDLRERERRRLREDGKNKRERETER